MARTEQSLVTMLLILFTIINLASASSEKYYETNYPIDLGLQEKITHLHFFFHDIIDGPNVTALRIAGPPMETEFSFLAMMHNPLTTGPEMNSTRIGSAHGMYGAASQTEIALLMAFTLEFSEGEFKGSSLSLLGLNAIDLEVREMPITGGTGAFRFARGYARVRTYYLDLVTYNAIVEYDIYVSHY